MCANLTLWRPCDAIFPPAPATDNYLSLKSVYICQDVTLSCLREHMMWQSIKYLLLCDNIISEIISPLITKPAVLTQKQKRMADNTVLDQNSVFNRVKSEKKRRRKPVPTWPCGNPVMQYFHQHQLKIMISLWSQSTLSRCQLVLSKEAHDVTKY